MLDRELRYRRVNARMAEMNGLPPEEHIGKTVREVVPDVADQAEPRLREVLETGSPALNVELFGETAARPGVKRFWLEHWRPLRDREGGIIGINVVAEELSAAVEDRRPLAALVERRTAELSETVRGLEREAEERIGAQEVLRRRTEVLQAVIDNIPVMLAFYDRDGSFVLCNREFERLVGWSREELPRLDVMQVCYPDAEYRRQVWEFMQEARPEWRTFMVTTRSGKTLESRWTNVRLSDGSQVGIGIDLSEIRGYEEELAFRSRLAEERARQLQALAAQLTEAEERERRRIASVIHDDLQQLLVGAKFQIGLLADEDPESREQARGQLDALLGQAVTTSRRLSHELSPPAFMRIGVVEAIRWLADHLKERYNLTVEVRADADYDVRSESARSFLYRSVQELLLNVRKHAGTEQAHVHIHRAGRWIRIAVQDRGSGFAAEEISPAPGGAGFGLFSMRERAAVLGARLHVHSRPGGGTQVVLEVPVEWARERAPAGRRRRGGPAAEPSAGGRALLYRVLLADDHKVMRQGLSILVSREPDMEVVGEAGDGEEALRLAQELQPDVVIMDVGMPRMDGIEATRRLRAKLPAVRVIGLSMYEDAAVAEKILAAGAQVYLHKAGPTEALLAAIRLAGPCG